MNEKLARRHAAALLGVAANATGTDARAAFLQKLERIDFVPPPEWCSGLSRLDKQTKAGGFRGAAQTFDACDHDAIRVQIKRFRSEYWELDSDKRKQRWQALLKTCRKDFPLLPHIRSLADGLEIDDGAFDEIIGKQGAIARFIRDTFPLNPVERSNQRNAWIVGLKSRSGWGKQARQFREDYRTIASLDTEFIEILAEFDSADDEQDPAPRTSRPRSVIRRARRRRNEARTTNAYIWCLAVGIAVFYALMIILNRR